MLVELHAKSQRQADRAATVRLPVWALAVCLFSVAGPALGVRSVTAEAARVTPHPLPVVAAPVLFERLEPQPGLPDRYLARTQRYAALLTSNALSLWLGPAASQPAVAMRFEGADPDIRAQGAVKSKVSRLIGRDPARWSVAAPRYAQVRFPDVYPGIDVVYYGSGGNIEYDVVVNPGARPETVVLAFGGIEGLGLADDGRLVLESAAGTLAIEPPQAYQDGPLGRQAVTAAYKLDPATRTVRFTLGGYDATRPLVIDPLLRASTYIGGALDEQVRGVAVDGEGNIFVAGTTFSADLPTNTGSPGLLSGAQDVFLAKFDPSGQTLLYSVYLGGSDADEAYGVAVDLQGNVYVTGMTRSIDFPLRGAVHSEHGGAADAFVAKFRGEDGALVYSTYLGGSDYERGGAIAVDATGAVYITGETRSVDFPLRDAIQAGYGGGFADAFIVKLNTAGSVDLFATYLGGSGDDVSLGVAVDAAGAVYLTGRTASTDFPVVAAYQEIMRGDRDAFVAKLDPSTGYRYISYLGGSGEDEGAGIAVDDSGAAYVAGYTASGDFPTTRDAFQTGVRFGDAFVSKFAPDGASLVYSTALGGTLLDRANAIAVDAAGRAFVVGSSRSVDFPILDAVQEVPAGGLDAFVAKLNAAGDGVIYSSYLGGTGNDRAYTVVIDRSDAAYLAGTTTSNDWPLSDAAFDSQCGDEQMGNCGVGSGDGFVVKLATVVDLTLSIEASAESVIVGSEFTYQATIGNEGVDTATGVVFTNILPSGVRFSDVRPEDVCSEAGGVVTCGFESIAPGSVATVTVLAMSQVLGPATSTVAINAQELDVDPSDNTAVATTQIVPLRVEAFGTGASASGGAGGTWGLLGVVVGLLWGTTQAVLRRGRRLRPHARGQW